MILRQREASMVRKAVIVGFLLASELAAAPRPEYNNFRCYADTVMICTADGKCADGGKPTVQTIVLPDSSGYMRCADANDLSTCDSYPVSATPSGKYLVVSNPGGSFFVKIDDALTFTEVVSLNHDVFINRGQCDSGPPIVTTRTPPAISDGASKVGDNR